MQLLTCNSEVVNYQPANIITYNSFVKLYPSLRHSVIFFSTPTLIHIYPSIESLDVVPPKIINSMGNQDVIHCSRVWIVVVSPVNVCSSPKTRRVSNFGATNSDRTVWTNCSRNNIKQRLKVNNRNSLLNCPKQTWKCYMIIVVHHHKKSLFRNYSG